MSCIELMIQMLPGLPPVALPLSSHISCGGTLVCESQCLGTQRMMSLGGSSSDVVATIPIATNAGFGATGFQAKNWVLPRCWFQIYKSMELVSTKRGYQARMGGGAYLAIAHWHRQDFINQRLQLQLRVFAAETT
jgi:hypothetical protein